MVIKKIEWNVHHYDHRVGLQLISIDPPNDTECGQTVILYVGCFSFVAIETSVLSTHLQVDDKNGRRRGTC